jgi:hypothetical protein
MDGDSPQSSVLSPQSSVLRLAIDVTAGVNQGAGVGRATREVVSALAGLSAPLALTLFYAAERLVTPKRVWPGCGGWQRDTRWGTRRLPLSPRWITFFWCATGCRCRSRR